MHMFYGRTDPEYVGGKYFVSIQGCALNVYSQRSKYKFRLQLTGIRESAHMENRYPEALEEEVESDKRYVSVLVQPNDEKGGRVSEIQRVDLSREVSGSSGGEQGVT